MDDSDVMAHINELVREEHELRGNAHGLDDAGRERLRSLEEQLDQYWDLLRQRRAKEEYGANPDEAAERPAGQVETYLQ
jgi:uncharacterized protein DUF2630